ncbi:MAG: hypothetical protein U0869_21705 [Chloroflexota bacterium]
MPRENVDIWVRLRNARAFLRDTGKVSGSVRQVGRDAQRASKGTGTMARSLGSLASAAGLGAIGMTALLAKIGGESVAEWREAEKAGKQTAAVIRSTGGDANVTAGHIGSLANQLSVLAGIDDEAIQGAENLLLTFTKVRNEAGRGNKVFDAATGLITDMSAAMGTSLRSSTIAVGKALNDPVKGITALRRVGVSFTKQQQDQIKALVKSGDTLGAQKIILRELRREFAGSAKAHADPLDKLNVSWKNLEETIGGFLGPKVSDAAEWLSGFIEEMQTGTGAGGRFVDQLEDIAGPLAKGAVAVGKFASAHPGLLKVLGAMIGIGVAVKAIRLVGTVTQIGRLFSAVDGLAGLAARTGTGAGGSIAARLAARFSTVFGTRFPGISRLISRLFGGAGAAAGTSLVDNVAATVGGGKGGLIARLKAAGMHGGKDGIFANLGRLGGFAFSGAFILGLASIVGDIEKTLGDALTEAFGGQTQAHAAEINNPSGPPSLQKDIARGWQIGKDLGIIPDWLGHRPAARHFASAPRGPLPSLAGALPGPARAGGSGTLHITTPIQLVTPDGRVLASMVTKHTARVAALS